MQAGRHVRMEAAESSDNLYASIDTAIQKIEKRMRKLVDRRKEHKGKADMATVEEKLDTEE